MHSLKNNQNFHVKSESGTAEADATVYVWLLLTHTRTVYLAQQPNIYILYCCIYTLQLWKAWFLCEYSKYFWDSVSYEAQINK